MADETGPEHTATAVRPRVGDPPFWLEGDHQVRPRREPLPGSVDVDVAIVGAGYTGLWTAYYLKREDPSLRIAVLDTQFPGYGASGRNGGWVTAFFPGPREIYERTSSREAVVAFQRAMFATVDEVGRVLEAEGIDAEYTKSGSLGVALSPAQVQRAEARIEYERGWGFGADDIRLLSRSELEARVTLSGGRRAVFSPHVARIHPGKLIRGLARLVEEMGVKIYERTPVSELRPRRAITPLGEVKAQWLVRATEAYTANFAALKRELAPINSSMVVTEPLDEETWAQIGWEGRELIHDGAHAYVYLQRTADGRIAIGGRGCPYRFGSSTAHTNEVSGRTIDALQRKLEALFPSIAPARISSAWSGVLGVPRDWCASVGADAASGVAWAGGYVGDGVAFSNLAGRTLRDLLLARSSQLTPLPWVGRSSPRWEPEPLRFVAIQAVYGALSLADRLERRTGRSSRLGKFVNRLSGRH
jgi:glycine/D-amino acid oxidase-like deaminating enzyme